MRLLREWSVLGILVRCYLLIAVVPLITILPAIESLIIVGVYIQGTLGHIPTVAVAVTGLIGEVILSLRCNKGTHILMSSLLCPIPIESAVAGIFHVAIASMWGHLHSRLAHLILAQFLLSLLQLFSEFNLSVLELRLFLLQLLIFHSQCFIVFLDSIKFLL